MLSKLILKFYLFITRYSYLFIQYYVKSKSYQNKENQLLNERLCIYDFSENIKDLIKNKEVICFIAASAGEFNAIKKLLTAIDSSDRFIVVMTCTKSGRTAFTQYKHPSNNIIHVYSPLDFPQVVQRFIDFWNPKALILVESEIWPNLIEAMSRVGKVALINGRMSPRSFKKWSIHTSVIKQVLSRLTFVAASSQSDLENYSQFYKEAVFSGNLKNDANPLTVNEDALKLIKKSIKERQTIVCASTHPGEEEILLEVYKELIKTLPDLLMIIAPRNIERGEEIEKLCLTKKITSSIRHKDEVINNEIKDGTQVYIANTMGELGTFFSLSKIVFLGGSLANIGGHNMCEPAMFECAIITGDKTFNFIDLVRDMADDKALIVIQNKNELLNAILGLFVYPNTVKEIGRNAAEFVRKNGGALQKTVKLMEKHEII